MKDTIVGGMVAGIIGGIVGVIYSYTMYLLNITVWSSVHLAATLVVRNIDNLTTGGYIWSIITHLLIAALFGVLLLLLLRYTGKDYWHIKSIGYGALFCLAAHSYFLPLLRTDLEFLPNASAFGVMVTTHAIIGLVAGFILVKYGQIEKVEIVE